MHRIYRLSASLLLVALALSLVGAMPLLAQEDECAYKIGLVTDVGQLNDQSFNEAAWNGIQVAAEELGLGEECFDYIESQDVADYIPNIEAFVDEGFDIVVTSGFLMTQATRDAGQLFPDIYFIGTDQDQVNENFEYDPISNVVGLVFDESISGFLAGSLAGFMTETDVIGGVYGADVPAVVRFRLGYEAGAKYVNPEINVLGSYYTGDIARAFNDPQWGGETARSFINEKDADVIFGAGGGTGNGALIAACNAGFPVIGVDVDQYHTVTEVQACIMSSAIKDLVGGVSDLILAVDEGTFEGGNIVGDSGLAPFHEWEDKIPDEVKTELDDIKDMIAAGEIETCVTEDEALAGMCIISGVEDEVLAGEALVQEYCLACHDVERIEANVNEDLDWWTETIEAMMTKEDGPDLTDEDIQTLLEYIHQ